MEINAENMLFDRLNALVKASSDKKIIIKMCIRDSRKGCRVF